MGATRTRISTPSTGSTRLGARYGWATSYLFVTALVVPLLYSNATIDPVEPLRFLVVALLGIVVITAFGVGVLRSKKTLSFNRAEAIVVGCLVASIVVAAISMLATGPTADGVYELLEITTFTWMLYVTSRAIDGDRSKLALLAKPVVLSAFLVGGFAILQYYEVAIFEWMRTDTSVDSTMGHRNLLGSYVLLAMPFVVYAFLEFGTRWRIASLATLLISGFLLAALQSRAIWVAFPAGVAVSLFLFAATRKRARPPIDQRSAYRRRAMQSAAIVASGVSIALLFGSPASSRAPMRELATSLVRLQHPSFDERLQLWSRTIRMIQEHPITGVGLGNWRIVIPAYGTAGMRSETGTLHFQRPHNDYLWVASETGIVGGALYVALFASVLVLAVSGMLRAPSTHDRLVLALMIGGVACYAVDSLFSFPKERMAHSVYLALLIGTLLSFHQRAAGRPAALSFARRWTVPIVLLVWGTTLLAGHVALARYRAEVHLRRALEARALQDWPSMVAELDRIDRRYYALDPTSAPVVWYRGVARFEMGDRETALADFRSALAVHPNHEHVLNNIATCQVLRGEMDDAIRAYSRAIELAPRFEEARVNLAAVLHSLGRDQEAYDVLAPSAASATSTRFVECFRSVKAALGMEE